MIVQIYSFIVKVLLRSKGVSFGRRFQSLGVPYVRAWGDLRLGSDVRINSGLKANAAFGFSRTTLISKSGGRIVICDGVGLSNVTIYSENSITIGSNTLLGAGVKIWDTDFHSLDVESRMRLGDRGLSEPVEIGDCCFIGAGAIVLKGVNIGNNSVIGAGSVVARDIPPNEIWAGNPCRFIRRLN